MFFLDYKIDYLVVVICLLITWDYFQICDAFHEKSLHFFFDDPAQDQVHDGHDEHIDENP